LGSYNNINLFANIISIIDHIKNYKNHIIQSVFNSFSNGETSMKSKKLSKFVKECKLIDKIFTIDYIYIFYAKERKPQRFNFMDISEFENAFELIAKKKEH